MKRFVFPLLIVFVAALAVSVVVSAKHEHVACKGHKEISPLPVEVRSKVEKLNLEHRLEAIDLQTRRAQLCGQMREELLKDKPDAKTLEKLAKEMDAARAKLHRQRIDHLLKVKQALPAEHWKVFLHKQAGSCACGGCAAGARHGAGSGCTHGAGGCCAAGARHGAGAGCTHGAGGGKHGAGAGCTHGAGGGKHGAGAGCPMASPDGDDAQICPLEKKEKGKR